LDAAECERSCGLFAEKITAEPGDFLPVSILTIEFPGPEQRGETQRWRGKIQWIGRIQPKELPMKSFLIAALSATTISALALQRQLPLKQTRPARRKAPRP
jgi:hypothetical protein